MCDYLVVSVSPDSVVRKHKGSGRPVQKIFERMRMLRALRCVQQVWVCPSEDASDAIILLAPSLFVKGADYASKGVTASERSACELVGAQIAYTQTEKRSTTDLIRRIRELA